MAVIYKPSHKFLGQNAVSIEYELRKLSQTLEEIEMVTNMNIFGRSLAFKQNKIYLPIFQKAIH